MNDKQFRYEELALYKSCSMKIITFLLLLFLLNLSCKKDGTVNLEPVPFSEAEYNVEFTGKWKSPEFGVPPGVHFTTIVGMIHNAQTFQWQEGRLASWGVERIAESGNPFPMIAEIDSIILLGQATSKLIMSIPPPTGSSKVDIICNTDFSFISFETMLAPTPDWFTGISSFNLFQGNKWITDTTVLLYSYDAGTETGDVFGYDNPETFPKENVHLLLPSQATVLTNGNSTLAPIGSVRFLKK